MSPRHRNTGTVPTPTQAAILENTRDFSHFRRPPHDERPSPLSIFSTGVNGLQPILGSGTDLRMKDFSAEITPAIGKFLDQTFVPEDSLLLEIRERAHARGLPPIHVGAMDGLHLEILTRIAGATKAVEIGTLAGYSAICICRGMGPKGILYTFDADRKHIEVAKESFEKAGVASQVKTFVGPASQNLPEIVSEGPFDLVFIDADKVGYPDYLHWAAENLKIGGLLIGDNTLAFGMLADETFESSEDEQTARALQRFNREAAQGGRFRATMIPTGEGLTLAVKIK